MYMTLKKHSADRHEVANRSLDARLRMSDACCIIHKNSFLKNTKREYKCDWKVEDVLGRI